MSDPWEQLVARQPRPRPISEVALAGAAAAPAATAACEWPTPAVPRIHASDLPYERFCLEFMEPNLPVLIEGATEGWAAARDWIAPDGGIDLDFLRRHFGSAQVAVTDTAREHEGAGPCTQMPLASYLDWWQQHSQGRRQQPGAAQQQAARKEESPSDGAGGAAGSTQAPVPLLYCKDWHLASEFPQYQAYSCPPFFRHDWLNEFYDAVHGRRGQHVGQPAPSLQQQEQQQERQEQGGGQAGQEGQQRLVTTSDYRFVYMGPQGTCTPLHTDVLRSHSWSANVAGRKRWRLLPPWRSHLLLDRRGREAAWDFFAPDPEGMFPGLPEARRHLVTVEQGPGKAIFVPSGWFHTVENLSNCVSINHNWINGHNAHWTWGLLQREREAAEAAIEDCRELCSPWEFEGLVQRNLGANAGLDWAGFGALLRCIAGASLAQLASLERQAAGAESAAEAKGDPPSAAGAASASAGADTAASPAGEDGGPGGRWYHAFRLLRAGLVLRELVSAQQRIEDACRLQAAGQQQQETAGQQQRQERQQSVGASDGSPARGEEELAHAGELDAYRACLERIERQLHAFGVCLPADP